MATAGIVIGASIPVLGSPPSSAAALGATITVVGHGWGHGQGMGQYGAYGYAQQGQSYQWILAHYYGGTVLTSTAVPSVEVSLSELYGVASLEVAASPGATLIVDGTAVGSPYSLQRGQTATSSGGTDVVVSGPYGGGSRLFGGSISLPAGQADVIDTVGLEAYVDGVVPREEPAGWPAAALEAQAVAARSYALAYTGGGAFPICDTGACQVYGGDPAQYPAPNDSTQSNAAVAATASQVLVCGSDTDCGAPSQAALTEYGSSSGGYTAGGAFPAVPDAGDATPANPNHDWSTTVATSLVQSAFPSVGTLESISITARNGLGDMGGRVTSMVLSGTAGAVTVSGATFAAAVGLLSDWFSVLGATPAPGSDTGYWVVAADGSLYPYGSAPTYGSMQGQALVAPVIGMAPTGDGAGYWMVAQDGGIFSFGDARFLGSTGGHPLVAPVIGMSSTPDSGGYWLVASDGGIFTFGDAGFFGSTGGVPLMAPIVAMARTGDGRGYWLVAADGGVFTFGDARFYGSLGGIRLDAPIVGMVPTSDGRGYWLLGSDGGVFAFGDAGFVGSLGGAGVTGVTSVSPTPDDGGYLLVTAAGAVYTFGDATFLGDPAATAGGWSGRAIGVFTR